MIVLAVDTTSPSGGAGVFKDGKPLAIVANDRPANLYSVTIFVMTEEALQVAGLTMKDVDVFAASNGPGSFTGIRVGLAASQGWARAFGRPVVGVSNLRAMVEATNPTAEWAAPIIDAHRGELFLGWFHRSSDRGESEDAFIAQDHGLVLKPENVVELCKSMHRRDSSEIAWIVREGDPASEALHGTPNLPGCWITHRGTLLPAMAAIAIRDHCAGRDQPLDEIHPRYIRRPDAELNWRG